MQPLWLSMVHIWVYDRAEGSWGGLGRMPVVVNPDSARHLFVRAPKPESLNLKPKP